VKPAQTSGWVGGIAPPPVLDPRQLMTDIRLISFWETREPRLAATRSSTLPVLTLTLWPAGSRPMSSGRCAASYSSVQQSPKRVIG
jgi:hypothetical protein